MCTKLKFNVCMWFILLFFAPSSLFCFSQIRNRFVLIEKKQIVSICVYKLSLFWVYIIETRKAHTYTKFSNKHISFNSKIWFFFLFFLFFLFLSFYRSFNSKFLKFVLLFQFQITFFSFMKFNLYKDWTILLFLKPWMSRIKWKKRTFLF
jgi:hypothetical protein